MAGETSHGGINKETSHDGTGPSSEERKNRPEWLINIINEERERLNEKTGNQADEQRKRPMTRIQKADKKLRESNEACFDPLVVSLGPFHHGKQGLGLMESYKKVSAVWFISLATGKPANEVTGIESNVYQKFIEKVKLPPRDLYADHESFYQSEPEDLMRMMFLDGCFILHFIHLLVKGSSDDLMKSSHHLDQPRIVRDMFLLENQIPYPILDALMSLLPEQKNQKRWIIEFIRMVFLPQHKLNFSEIGCLRVPVVIFECLCWPIWESFLYTVWKNLFGDKEPLHLLDILRAVLIGTGPSPDSSYGSGYWYFVFRPIRELKATGIHVRRSKTGRLRDVQFQKGILNSHLEIPLIIVDDWTKTRLINLVAYEMCSDGPKDRTVTSYVCLLHSLIYNADDAEELQSKNILLNRLRSNEEVAILFKELATNLSPHNNAYGLVINGIKGHFKRHFNDDRVRIGKWIGQFIRTYFSSPWTLISLIAAAFIIVLTLLQTIYTMWGFYK